MKRKIMNTPSAINWNYTYKCNLNCIHCYSRTRDRNDDASWEDKLKIANNIIKNNVFAVNLGGGEPIFLDDCFDIIKYLRNYGVFVSLSTNGMAVDNDKADRLAEARLSSVAISMDNTDSDKHNLMRGNDNSFQSALNATKMFVDRGINVVFSTVITSQNYDDLDNIVKLASDCGCKGVSFKRLKIMGNAIDNKQLALDKEQEGGLYEKVKGFKNDYNSLDVNLVYSPDGFETIDDGCPCGWSALAIIPNGDIYPCVYNNISCLGNAIKDDIGDIWRKSEELNYMRENFSCMGLLVRKGINNV